MRAPDAAPDVSRRAPSAAPPGHRRPGRLRRAGAVTFTLVLATTVAVLGLVTATRWLDAAVPPTLPAVQALVPMAAVPTALVLLVAAVARRWRTATAAAVLAAVHLALAMPWWLPATATPPATPADELTVVAGNLQYGFGDARTVARAALARDADVLVVVEATPAVRDELEASGIRAELPYVADHPVFRRFGDAGLVDAHRQLGGGRPRTWPTNQPDLPPLFDLDHVLARGFVAIDGGTLDVDGTDHAALWARLAPVR